jgi:hypothetical protein
MSKYRIYQETDGYNRGGGLVVLLSDTPATFITVDSVNGTVLANPNFRLITRAAHCANDGFAMFNRDYNKYRLCLSQVVEDLGGFDALTETEQTACAQYFIFTEPQTEVAIPDPDQRAQLYSLHLERVAEADLNTIDLDTIIYS